MEPNKQLWNYVGLSDRETLLTGTLGWLMDPSGNHNAGPVFLQRIFRRIGFNDTSDLGNYEVEVEETDKRSRFDLRIKRENQTELILEAKCKTYGSKKQLEKYEKSAPVVGRIGYGEFNYPDLNDEERKKFPLLTYQEVAEDLEVVKQKADSYNDLIDSVKHHITLESQGFENLKQYYFQENVDQPPAKENRQHLGTKFLHELYWRWFKEMGDFTDWKQKNDVSGTWCANHDRDAKNGEFLAYPGLGLSLPGPVHTWIQLELQGDLYGRADEIIGKCELRVSHEQTNEHRQTVYNVFKENKENLRDLGMPMLSRKPSNRNNYYTALRRMLTRAEFRYSALRDLIVNRLMDH
jgi:hypothetical protein